MTSGHALLVPCGVSTTFRTHAGPVSTSTVHLMETIGRALQGRQAIMQILHPKHFKSDMLCEKG